METFGIVLVSSAISGVIVWLIARARQAELNARLQGREETLARAEVELQTLRKERDELKTQCTRIESALGAERASLDDARTKLTDAFKALSADALSTNTTRFLEVAKETFGKLHLQSENELIKRQEAVDSLVKPLRESLEKVDSKIGELEKTRASAYGALAEQLKSLAGAQSTLQIETAKLSTALRSTSGSGSWGELQLKRVVELADMTGYCDFIEQETSGALRADMVIRLPGGQRIVVDAKAPNEAFRDAASAIDEGVRKLKYLEHAGKVRGHVDALGAKAYWEQFQPSPEFVVLFLPGDQFLSAALQADPLLFDRAISRKVLLATPITLIALLKATAYGWRQESLSKNAEEISSIGRQLHERLATFAEHFEKIGRGLDGALKSYNAAIGSFESSVVPGARKFSELGAKGSKELPSPAPIETAPRDILKRS